MNIIIFFSKIKRRLFKIASKSADFYYGKKKNKIKQCYNCGEHLEKFYRYPINKDVPRAIDHFQMVGSDPENFGCYYCNSTDRERHLFMFFDRINFWEKIRNRSILHIAPEVHLINKIEKLNPSKYIKGDLYPHDDLIKVDITKMQFNDNTFDILICNHVLEHVPNHFNALKEIERVLKPKGVAVLQTPYSELLYDHFEDKNIKNDALKLNFYGQEDHVKIISKRAFFEELSLFFDLNIIEHTDLFSDEESVKYGVNKKEALIMIVKKNHNG